MSNLVKLREALERETQDVYVRFGEKLRKAREARELSQSDLARSVCLNRCTVNKIEKGTQRILLHDVLTLAEFLKLDLNSLKPKP